MFVITSNTYVSTYINYLIILTGMNGIGINGIVDELFIQSYTEPKQM